MKSPIKKHTQNGKILIATILVLFCFSSCLDNQNEVSTVKNMQFSEETNDNVIALVASQRIVQERIKSVDSLSNNKRHISLTASLKNSLKNIYLVKVFEDNGTNLVSYYNFLVDANSMKIVNPDGKLE